MNAPIQLLLTCPLCNHRHIDEGEFATKPHHTHACQRCGHVWRPAVEHTVGVRYLMGFKNGPDATVRNGLMARVFEAQCRDNGMELDPVLAVYTVSDEGVVKYVSEKIQFGFEMFAAGYTHRFHEDA